MLPTPTIPFSASMRSASRGLQIPGVRGARRASPAVPAPGARALACGSPALPGRPRLPGWSWAAGGAAVLRRGLGGAAGRSRGAAAGLSHRSPPAATPHHGGEQLAGGGAEEDPEPARAGGRRGGARGQLAARAGLREEAEGDRKGSTHHPLQPTTQKRLPPCRPHRAPQSPPEPTCPCPHGPECTWAAGVGLCVGALPIFLCPSIPSFGSNLKAPRGSGSGVEKVLEAAFSPKGLHFWGVCVWPECLGCAGMCTLHYWHYLLEGGKGRGKSLPLRTGADRSSLRPCRTLGPGDANLHHPR